MDVITMIQEYLIVPVFMACLVIGYLYKNKTSADNKNIPIVVTVCGLVIALLLKWETYESVSDAVLTGIMGMVSGLASTGFHQLLIQYLKKDKSNE